MLMSRPLRLLAFASGCGGLMRPTTRWVAREGRSGDSLPDTVKVVTDGAAGFFARTPAERADPVLAWRRADEAFFASGACHVLAWAVREALADRAVEIALRRPGDTVVCHVYAVCDGWSFDHAGWRPRPSCWPRTRPSRAARSSG
jgi:hypothetical protein